MLLPVLTDFYTPCWVLWGCAACFPAPQESSEANTAKALTFAKSLFFHSSSQSSQATQARQGRAPISSRSHHRSQRNFNRKMRSSDQSPAIVHLLTSLRNFEKLRLQPSKVRCILLSYSPLRTPTANCMSAPKQPRCFNLVGLELQRGFSPLRDQNLSGSP